MSQLFMTVILVFFGAVIGSFVNVLIDRIPRGISPLRGRSFCMKCKRQIRAYENIPIVSYIALRGKCAGCGDIIPKRLIVVETVMALGFAYLYFFGISHAYSISQIIFLLVVFVLFVWIFFTDLDYGIIPDQANVLLIIAACLYIAGVDPSSIISRVLSAIGASVFFLALFIGTKGRGMGFGDVKLSFVLGLVLGYPAVIFGLYGAFLTGAVVSIILVIWRRKNFKKDTVPFGPFLVFSSLVALLYGTQIAQQLIEALL